MSKKVILGSAAGALIGLVSGTAINKVLYKASTARLEKLDAEFENTLSDKQLALKRNVERAVEDHNVSKAGSIERVNIEYRLKKAVKEFKDTLRQDQLISYNKLTHAVDEHNKRFKVTTLVMTLLGGLAGGVIASQFNKENE